MTGYEADVTATAGDVSMPANAALCERRLAAQMLLNGSHIAGPVVAADFSHSWYRELFGIIKTLEQRYPDTSIGPVEVKDELFRLHHQQKLTGFADKAFDLFDVLAYGYGADAGYAVERILEAAETRLIQSIGSRMAQGVADPSHLLHDAQADLQAIRIRRGGTDLARTRLDELVRQAKLEFATAIPTAIPTKLLDLDHMLNGGFRPGTLNVVGARPGVGKSLLGCTVARNVAELGRRVLYVTMELAATEVRNRLLANIGNIELTHLQNPEQLTDYDRLKIDEAEVRVAGWELHVEEGSRSISQIEHLAGSYFAGAPGGLMVVDFLQRIREDGTAANRERHVALCASRLTDLSHDLGIPVLCVVSFSRESARRGGQPRMDDIRDSGGVECLTGDTRIARADTGERVQLRDLAGVGPVPVWSVDEQLRIRAAVMTKVWRTGTRPTWTIRFASGRKLTATANHPLLTVHGWKPVEQLAVGDALAVARTIPEPAQPIVEDENRLILLAHLIGDGCTLPGRCVHYTTADQENAEAVVNAARAAFGIEATVEPRRRGVQAVEVRLSDPAAGRWRPNLLREWLAELGLMGCRSWQKTIPQQIFRLPTLQVRLFLRHLWATDGSVSTSRTVSGTRVSIYYSTTSRGLAEDVQALLLRVGITARLRATPRTVYRQGWAVVVSGVDDQRRFLADVGVHGARGKRCNEALRVVEGVQSNRNVGGVPADAWDYIRKAMRHHGITTRELATRIGTAYNGHALYRTSIGRSRMARIAAAVQDRHLVDLASSDVDWDRIVSVVPAGAQDVYDAHVPGPASFLANEVVSHNSDADTVILMWHDNDWDLNTIDVVVDKNRYGVEGRMQLVKQGHRGRVASAKAGAFEEAA